ncbi:MAG TPA: heme-binding protein [Gammaproteobacteria bacterium]|nr:heme-binding protein [Gammaproteobacteria bacterium]
MNISVEQNVIDWRAAQAAVTAAVDKAEQSDIKINVAVVDSGGNLAAFLRMPGAFLHSIDIAIDKAYTSASFGFPTSQWQEIFADEEMLKLGMPNRDRLVVFGGGLPLTIENMHLGGIGVSGGSADQDADCAQAGIDAVRSLLEKQASNAGRSAGMSN